VAAPRAQQPAMRRIGVLLPAVANDPEYQARVGAFMQALALLGWADGRNVRIETRWGAGDADRFKDMVNAARAPIFNLSP